MVCTSRKIFFCVLLLWQNVTQVLITRYSLLDHSDKYKSDNLEKGEYPYLPTVVTLYDDLLKCTLSFCMIFALEGYSVKNVWYKINREIISQPRQFVKLAFPAFLYVVQDNLVLTSLSMIEPSEFQILFQLKIPITAFLSVLVLKKSLLWSQWGCLFTLLVGVLLVKWQGKDTFDITEQGDQLVGVVAVLTACITSSICGVYFEKYFKTEKQTTMKDISQDSFILGGSSNSDLESIDLESGSGDNFEATTNNTNTEEDDEVPMTMWVSELSLALWSIPIGVASIFVKDYQVVKYHGLMTGFDPSTWAVIGISALGGMLSLIVVTELDNIVKNITSSLSFVPVIMISTYFFDFHPYPTFYMGSILVLLSAFFYINTFESLCGGKGGSGQKKKIHIHDDQYSVVNSLEYCNKINENDEDQFCLGSSDEENIFLK